MSSTFLSECKDKVFHKMASLLEGKNQVTLSMKYSALADSKYIRSGLVFASGHLTGRLSDLALVDMAASIELMHTYSLIHDDLPAMDNDDMRRGQASNHIVFNEATSILAGDALQALAFEVIASSAHIQDKHKIEIIKSLAVACGHQGMVLGQQFDLDAEHKKFHDIERIHTLKTAKLIQVALTMPHLDENQSLAPYSLLYELGEKLGLAFQIMDDVLEASSDSGTLGKSNASDIENKKMTYVSVFGVVESERRAGELLAWCNDRINQTFTESQARHLIELAHYMVARSH